MPNSSATDVVAAVLQDVQRRDVRQLAQRYHPRVEFHWPCALPYGGSFQGLAEVQAMSEIYARTWQPLGHDLQWAFVAASDAEVVVRYFVEGRDAQGSIRVETLAWYTVDGEQLRAARMFYRDLDQLLAFLSARGSFAAGAPAPGNDASKKVGGPY